MESSDRTVEPSAPVDIEEAVVESVRAVEELAAASVRTMGRLAEIFARTWGWAVKTLACALDSSRGSAAFGVLYLVLCLLAFAAFIPALNALTNRSQERRAAQSSAPAPSSTTPCDAPRPTLEPDDMCLID